MVEEKNFKISRCDISKRDVEANEKSNDENRAVSSLEALKKFSCSKTNIQLLLNSPKFHFFIIALVVLDCLFVAGELIIDYIEIHIYSKTNSHSDEIFFKANPRDMDLIYENVTSFLSNRTTLDLVSRPNFSVTRTLKILEKICKYSSFTILTIFVVDILIKVLIEPKKFLKLFELFDAIVVFSGFFLNLYLINSNVVIHSLSGLITVLRYNFCLLRIDIYQPKKALVLMTRHSGISLKLQFGIIQYLK